MQATATFDSNPATEESAERVRPPSKGTSRRRRGEGHIRKRRGRYYAVFSVNGRKVERAAGSRSADAVALLNRFKEEARQGILRIEKAPTFDDFVKQFQDLDDRKLKPSTRSAYDSIMRVHLQPFFGHRRLDTLTPSLVTRFFSELAAKKAKKRNSQLSTKTLLNAHRLLTKVCNLAVDLQIIPRSPVPRPKKLLAPVDEKEMDFLCADEIKRLLANVGDPEMKVFFATAIMTGMRSGELTALQWDCIRWDKNVIRVKRAFSRKQLTTPKTRKGKRDIVADRHLMRLLTEHKLRCGGRSEFVFSSSTGKPLDGSNILKRELRPALIQAGITRPLRLHDLRHTRASMMMNENCNPKFLQEQLGHSSIVVTMDRYAHLIVEKHESTVDKVGELLLGDGSETPR